MSTDPAGALSPGERVIEAGAGARRRRYQSLDGLRGVAAAVVVVHHAFLLAPSLSDAYLAPGGVPPSASPLAALLAYSPLHLIWAGGEAVLLFFVLSGVVLSLPAMRRGFSWVSYYPRRVVRLYVPVVAAVAFTALTLVLARRSQVDGFSGWVNGHGSEYTVGTLAHDLTLVRGISGVITPLWSLQWEVLFSLLLPLYVGVALLVRKQIWIAAGLVALVVVLGAAQGSAAWFYLGVFAIGTVLASQWGRIATAAQALNARRWSHTFWVVLLALAVYLTIGHWLVLDRADAAGVSPHAGLETVAGVTILVVAAGFYPPLVRVLETRAVLWLGRISFSLYLVHESILLAGRYLAPRLPVPVVVLLAVPVCFLIAALFTRAIEVPSHGFARRVGTVAEQGAARVRAALVPRLPGRRGAVGSPTGAGADAGSSARREPVAGAGTGLVELGG